MSDRLKGKRAFVTAAAAGIGRACAAAFAREGARVFATDIDETALVSLKNEGVAEVARLDARSSADIAAMAKRVGKIDVLPNAAGFVHHGTILDCAPVEWDASFVLNVRSMYLMIRAFLPKIVERGTAQRLHPAAIVETIIDRLEDGTEATRTVSHAGMTNVAAFELILPSDQELAARMRQWRTEQIRQQLQAEQIANLLPMKMALMRAQAAQAGAHASLYQQRSGQSASPPAPISLAVLV